MDTPSDAEVEQLGEKIDLIPEVAGAGIGFVGDGVCTVLRAPAHSSGLPTYVVLQEDDGPPPPTGPPPSITLELAGVGLNCAGAVGGWIALTGEGIAAAGTGGAAAILVPVTWAATISASIQCGASLIRASDTIFNKGTWTRWMDSNDYYVWTSTALDVISLAGAAVSGTAAIRAARAIRQATGRSWYQVLKGLSRAERKRLTEEIIRLKNPGISGRGMKDLISIGKFPRRLEAAELSKRLFRQLVDAFSATLSFASSSASGVMHGLYLHVVQE